MAAQSPLWMTSNSAFARSALSLQALKELLGHSDIKTTLIYAHLSPAHLRSEVAKTERQAEPAAIPAQDPTELETVSRK